VRAAASFIAGVGLLVAGCGGGGREVPALPTGQFMAVEQSLTPPVQLFAEPVVARVDVLVDGERFDPDRVRVAGFFQPYELDGEVVRERRDQGRYTHLRYEFTLRCLVWECLPHTEDPGATPVSVAGGVERPPPPGGARDRKVHKLRAARVLYDDPQEGTQRVRNVTWPEVVSVSRLNFSDYDVSVLGFPFEASVTPLPEASYRFPPTLVGIGLLVAALALLALPTGLVVSAFRRKPAPVVDEEEPELPPLERALRLVEWACEGDAEERREALEALAGELDTEDAVLAGEARRLAWSRELPSPDAAADLVRRVREADARA
jgi:hypothetical protein